MLKTREPLIVILLSIVTCGIYGIVWMFMMNNEIKQLSPNRNNDVDTIWLVLGILCGFIYYYVWYKWDKQLADITAYKNIRYNSNFVLWIILSVFVGIGFFVMLFQVQDTMNEAINSNDNNTY
jgi:lipopolysaccharide export system protein LptC